MPVHREIRAHVPEDYWYIYMYYETGEVVAGPAHNRQSCEFTWARKRLFDRHSAVMLYEMCVDDPIALVTKVLQHRCMLLIGPY